MHRRGVLTGIVGLALGGALGTWAGWSRGSRPALDDDGLPTAELRVGDAAQLARNVAAGGPLLLPDGRGRIAVTIWDPGYRSARGSAIERYGPGGEDHPIVAGGSGLLALSLISTDQGCRVPFCESSHQFEDPCHASHWNAWGEWVDGRAPRGLDRFASRIDADGILVVDLTRQLPGPARDAGVLDQPARGPSCVGG